MFAMVIVGCYNTGIDRASGHTFTHWEVLHLLSGKDPCAGLRLHGAQLEDRTELLWAVLHLCICSLSAALIKAAQE